MDGTPPQVRDVIVKVLLPAIAPGDHGLPLPAQFWAA
jgi:hypothetical protein